MWHALDGAGIRHVDVVPGRGDVELRLGIHHINVVPGWGDVEDRREGGGWSRKIRPPLVIHHLW